MRGQEIAERNARLIPGGTTSGARYLDPPVVFTAAQGARLRDADGRDYVDLHGAYGAIVLGHRDAAQQARIAQLTGELDLVGLGTTALEGDLAALLVEHVPCAEMVAFCSSGTEATLHALRLARAITKRRLLVKFQGTYHGWHDYVAMNFMTPRSGLGRKDPFSAGILPEALESTLILPFNDIDAFERTMRERGGEIAAVILEPIMHNVGTIEAEPEFLEQVRRLTRERGVVLVFDEVITGIRHALGGYQAICGVTPDLATFGKALGNGYPIAALAGRRELMQRLAPAASGGDVSLGGTFNGLPLSMAAGIAVFEALSAPDAHSRLRSLGERLARGLNDASQRAGAGMIATHYGSVVCVQFVPGRARRYEDLAANDNARDVAFRKGLLRRGFACSTTPLRRFHLTLAHDERAIDAAIGAAEEALREAAGFPR
ncbi:MAG TPA: aspartate aminotransferase family protein [Burkholderiaceae bacterium]|nr:aspartate aminotransferase family protein [Burkholderiaceae bacterium]